MAQTVTVTAAGDEVHLLAPTAPFLVYACIWSADIGSQAVKSAIWISYDLGVNGDYEGMYAWLDDHGAKECGSSVAFVKSYDYDGEDLMQALKYDIQGAVKINEKTRIYVIRRVDGKKKGRFLFGRRKEAPWDGRGR